MFIAHAITVIQIIYLSRCVLKPYETLCAAIAHLQLEMDHWIKHMDGTIGISPWALHGCVHVYQYLTGHYAIVCMYAFITIVYLAHGLQTYLGQSPALIHENTSTEIHDRAFSQWLWITVVSIYEVV